MRNLIITTALAAVGTGALLVNEHNRRNQEVAAPRAETSQAFATRRIHAPGRVEGRTESILIRPEFPGVLAEIPVTRGSRVQKGSVLFRLDEDRYRAQRDFAAAELAAARAEKTRLIDGARTSEIEAARQETVAADAILRRSRKNFERAQKLFQSRAISAQELDERRSELDSNQAILRAAEERYETVKAPPRASELASADAAIASAAARLRLAEIDLQKCSAKCPTDAIVLNVDMQVGEWISPEMPEDAIELSDVESLRVVAEIDERDSLLVQVGQPCEVTSDAATGQVFSGIVVEIEPRMQPKTIYGGWAGERNETHTRSVWIQLRDTTALPVGLPVEVNIEL